MRLSDPLIYTLELSKSFPHRGTKIPGIVLILTCLVFFSHSCSSTSKIVGPVKESDLRTVWIGLSDDELYLVRVDLRVDEQTMMGFVFSDNEPEIFPIQAWSYDRGQIAIYLDSDTATRLGWYNPIRGSASFEEVDLELRGEDWKHLLAMQHPETQ